MESGAMTLLRATQLTIRLPIRKPTLTPTLIYQLQLSAWVASGRLWATQH